MEDNKNLLFPVYTTSNRALFMVAKSLLDNAGVEYTTKGENLEYAYGGSLVIEVTKENADEAHEILKDFIKGNQGVPKNEVEKINFEQKKEFSHAMTIGIILLVIFLIIIAVVFVRC